MPRCGECDRAGRISGQGGRPLQRLRAIVGCCRFAPAGRMHQRRASSVLLHIVLPIMFSGSAGAAWAKSEIKGAAILNHPCGKAAVKQMGLVHAGKMDEANKLTTKHMQDQGEAMPAKDREMMSGMAKMMSVTEEQFASDIKANGALVIDGQAATRTVKSTTKNSTSTNTMEQDYKLNGDECLMSR